jgi:HAD superfamily phosphatase
MKKNLVVFDMDGVIVDVSASYRDVVRHTAGLFFQPAQGAEKLPDPLFDLADLAAVKQSGGLNNDWDLTYLVIKLLFSLADNPPIHGSRSPWNRYHENIRRCGVAPMAAYLRSTDKPLVSLLKEHSRLENEFIKSLHEGDVGSGNIIKQIFQEIYLGPELFKSTYNLEPQVYSGDGFILKEKVLIDRSVLDALSRNNLLAIATGRPRAEAEYPLKHYDLKKYFYRIFTLDDCLEAEERILAEKGEKVSLSKPHPFMLDAIAEGLKDKFLGYYYVGDMPDDILAAANSRFGFKSIGVMVSAPNKLGLEKKLKRAGADFLVENFDALTEIIL